MTVDSCCFPFLVRTIVILHFVKEKIMADKMRDLPANQELERLRRENETLKSLILRKALLRKLEWEDLPVEWEDDLETILKSLEASAISWCDLSPKWKRDIKVVCTVFEMYPKSEEPFLPNWKRLPFQIMTNKDVVVAALGTTTGLSWDEVPIKLRRDPDVLFSAWERDMISFHDIPESLRTSHPDIAWEALIQDYISAEEATCFTTEDFREAIENHDIHWRQIPLAMQNDEEYVKSLEGFFRQALQSLQIEWHNLPRAYRFDASFAKSLSPENMVNVKLPVADENSDETALMKAINIYADFLRCNESLCEDRSFWLNQLLTVFGLALWSFAPLNFRHDREFLIKACIKEPHLVRGLDASFVNERSFISAVLAGNALFLGEMDHSTQLKYSDLVKEAIPVLGKGENTAGRKYLALWSVKDNLDPSFWDDDEFLMLWICADLNLPTTFEGSSFVLTEQILARLMSNPSLRVAYAKHTGKFCSENEDDEIRGDCGIMTDIVECHPFLYTKAVGKAREDPWVLVTALANSRNFAHGFLVDLHTQEKDDEIDNIVSFVSTHASTFRNFHRHVLGSETSISLTLQALDPETSRAIKTSIAEYMGVVTGKKLQSVLQAELNVNDAVMQWS